MTPRPTTTFRPVFDSVDDAVSLLRDNGRRLSEARRHLLDALFAAGRLVTAEELAEGLGGRIPPSDVAVVYRNLETLQQLGLVRHVHLGHAPGRYAIAGRRAYEYLVCERCGEIEEVETERLERVKRMIEYEFDFYASFTHFPIAGLCDSCAGRPARSPR